MRFSELQIGVKLELEIYDDDNEKVEPSFTSKIEMVMDHHRVVVAAPIHEGVIYPVHIGWTIAVYFIQNGDLYKFNAKIIDRNILNNIAYLIIERTEKIHKIQRRQYFRFECILPFKYIVIDTDLSRTNDKTIQKTSITKDISGGGLCVKLDEKIGIKKYLECELVLKENKIIRFVGKVIRSGISDNLNQKYRYEIGLVFKEIDKRDKEAIIKYIFEEQRELRKKGLI